MWLAESRVNGTGRAVIIQEDFRRAREVAALRRRWCEGG